MNKKAAVTIPDSWEEVYLADVLIALETGKRPKGGVQGITNGVPSIGGEHLNSCGGFNFGNIKFVPGYFAETINRARLKVDDILVVKDGATTGKISYINMNFPFEYAVINEHIFICRCVDQINNKYVFYFLFSQAGNKQILADFCGAAQGGISRAFIDKALVPIAPLNEQHRIVAKIEALKARSQKAKEALDAIPLLLDQFRQSVLAAAFRGDLTADWRAHNLDVEPASDLLERVRTERRRRWEEVELEKMKVNGKKPTNETWKAKYKEPESVDTLELPDLPDGWCWVTADECTSLITDGEHARPERSDDGVYLLSARNILDGQLSFKKVDFIPEPVYQKLEKRLKIEVGDVFLSCSGSVGRSCVAPPGL